MVIYSAIPHPCQLSWPSIRALHSFPFHLNFKPSLHHSVAPEDSTKTLRFVSKTPSISRR